MVSRYMDDRTLLRIDTLLKHIDQIFGDTANISIDDLIGHNKGKYSNYWLLKKRLVLFSKHDIHNR